MGPVIRLCAVLLVCVAAGCAPVEPWQRGLLAHPAMQTDDRAEEDRARQHMMGARESSQGALGEPGGGGCGCN
jgi:hypothetical protein